MNVFLAPDSERIVKNKVAAGWYSSPSEMVQVALQLLESHDELQRLKQEALRRDIRAGLDALERGEKRAGEEVFAAIGARYVAQQEKAS